MTDEPGSLGLSDDPRVWAVAKIICAAMGDDPARRIDCLKPDGSKFGTLPAWSLYVDAAKHVPLMPAGMIS